MKTDVFKLLCLFLIAGNYVSAQAGFKRFVNPFIGTDGTGHSFPGPCRPFGMVQPAPQFKKITVRLPHSKKLIITARSSGNVNRASVTLNGNPISKNQIGYSELMKGGMLTFNN